MDGLLENLIVALIVAASAWFALRRYLPRKKAAKGGCGSGCSSCDTCGDAPSASTRAPSTHVVTIHRR